MASHLVEVDAGPHWVVPVVEFVAWLGQQCQFEEVAFELEN